MLTKGEGDNKQYGTMIPAGKNRYTSMFLTMMMWNAGGTYFDKDYNVTFNNPGTIKALEFMKRMSAYTLQDKDQHHTVMETKLLCLVKQHWFMEEEEYLKKQLLKHQI